MEIRWGNLLSNACKYAINSSVHFPIASTDSPIELGLWDISIQDQAFLPNMA